MARISRSDVDAAFRVACQAAAGAGVDVAGWAMEPGSAANGIPWRLVRVSPGTGRWPLGGSSGYLGLTMADAHARLSAYREAWLLVSDQHTREREHGE